MADPFENHASKLESPFSHALTITPNNTDDLSITPRALYCTGPGVVQVTMIGGGVAVFPMVFGVPLPARVRRVWNTGTTATGIVAVW